MSYDLISYFNSKFSKLYHPENRKALPFITISREAGCGANNIASMIKEKIEDEGARWKVVNKEIIDQAVSQLKVDKHRVNDIINAKDRSIADEILNALSTRYYKNDRMLRKSIKEILRYDAGEGNIIIVGRGGVAVTQDLPLGMHIKFIAPVDWRKNRIIQMRGLSEAEAMEYLTDMDKKRNLLLEQLSNKKFDNTWFDLIINCATFNPSQIVNLILYAMKERQLL